MHLRTESEIKWMVYFQSVRFLFSIIFKSVCVGLMFVLIFSLVRSGLLAVICRDVTVDLLLTDVFNKAEIKLLF